MPRIQNSRSPCERYDTVEWEGVGNVCKTTLLQSAHDGVCGSLRAPTASLPVPTEQ
jgi:hypothetical protein